MKNKLTNISKKDYYILINNLKSNKKFNDKFLEAKELGFQASNLDLENDEEYLSLSNEEKDEVLDAAYQGWMDSSIDNCYIRIIIMSGLLKGLYVKDYELDKYFLEIINILNKQYELYGFLDLNQNDIKEVYESFDDNALDYSCERIKNMGIFDFNGNEIEKHLRLSKFKMWSFKTTLKSEIRNMLYDIMYIFYTSTPDINKRKFKQEFHKHYQNRIFKMCGF